MFAKVPRVVTYSYDALKPLDYPCELDGKTISDHDWVTVDYQTEEVVDCSFKRKRLTTFGTSV